MFKDFKIKIFVNNYMAFIWKYRLSYIDDTIPEFIGQSLNTLRYPSIDLGKNQIFNDPIQVLAWFKIYPLYTIL